MTTALAPAPGLAIGPIRLDAPVVLAPMAGITNTAFRRLCREYGAGLYVSEMITSRALVERTPESMRLIGHHESETTRSVQLYGVDPTTVEAAVRLLRDEDRADHIDLNFGCPVPKVTRKGGGAALPWKIDLFREIVERAVTAAGPLPLTVKMRKGIDADHLTYLEAGRIAEGAGVAAVALHARTAADFYSGSADWSAITALKQTVTEVPVLGNGDIWSADDAARMMAQTGCDGVVVGRGCLGRPWLFGDLAAALGGAPTTPVDATLGFVARAFRRHAQLLAEFFDDDAAPAGQGSGGENRACRDIRKHVAWYFKGYAVGGELRAALARVSSLAELDDLLGQLDPDQPYPGADAEGQRGRAGSPKSPLLPERWLESRSTDRGTRADLAEAESSVSGG
ncbi:tRNA dihydrouridine synthase DusB [uncultured Amnibacterium sp.]|uniref:tRNA dihydrouridine synthase DusB n=1 Tax=uncultured Amnibacterium sp. TaxID=1631851 RepID=UPI0035CA73AA